MLRSTDFSGLRPGCTPRKCVSYEVGLVLGVGGRAVEDGTEDAEGGEGSVDVQTDDEVGSTGHIEAEFGR